MKDIYADMTSSSLSQIKLGVFGLNEVGNISGTVSTSGSTEYFFDVSDSMGVYLRLADLSDDLDISLLKYSSGSYSKIASSENSGIDSESIFKYMSPGSYKAIVSYYE